MSKAILVVDMPDSCLRCNMLNGNDYCVLQSDDENFRCDTFSELKENCPLKEVPKYKRTIGKATETNLLLLNHGWNDCIDEILKGCESDE